MKNKLQLSNIVKYLYKIFVKHSIVTDLIVIISLIILNHIVDYHQYIQNKDDLKDMLTCLISTLVTVSGFSLAAFTIITTIRSNVLSKTSADKMNGLDLLFSGSRYLEIVKIFKEVIIEQVLFSLVLILIWLFISKENYLFSVTIICATYILSVSLLRLLFMLFKLLAAEKYQDK